jgi:D-alanyl-lipoteichoic acid acyltransferase DltB (MBOAT superfamily)
VLFNSLHFGIFFVVVFAVTWALHRAVPARNAFLLAASYYFYGSWDWRFLSLILLTTTIDYWIGRALDVRSVDPANPPKRTPRRKLILVGSLVANLGILGFFKYFNFFVDSAKGLLRAAGVPFGLETLDIVLPVGVSFYTFQSLSYTIDLYRGRLPTERSFLNFALFVSFFPQLVAGPIERATHLLPQMRVPWRFTAWGIQTGFHLIGWGLLKKVVLADNIAKVTDAVFAAPNPSGLEVVLGVYAFAVQIYCDFSAYSDIARGTARCLGVDIMLNFNLPYFATNPSEFWKRWHISLSTWLRDYLYIPLGGNRHGPRRTYLNLALTMLLGGLWHGAAWTFVVWGAYHGVLLIGHRLLEPIVSRAGFWRRWLSEETRYWARMVFFFQLVCLSWLLFRADSMTQAWQMLHTVFTDFSFGLTEIDRHLLRTFAACWVVFWAVQILQWKKGDFEIVLRLPAPVRTLAYAAGILGFVWFGEYGGDAFIYFQF